MKNSIYKYHGFSILLGGGKQVFKFEQLQNMTDKFNEIRESILALIFADIESKLQETVENFQESDVTNQDIETVKEKYLNTFKVKFDSGLL